MTKEEIINRIDELCIEKDVSKYRLMQDAEISSIIYQWKKNIIYSFLEHPILSVLQGFAAIIV